MAYCKVIWLWIQILWPWPQLHKCQCSRFAFTEQTATAKLILTWLLPLQRHSQKQRCACAFAMPAHSAAVGSPSSPLVAAEGTGENWCLYPSHPSRLFSAGWISSCQPPANLFVTSSWLPQLGILLQQKLLKFVYQLPYSTPDFVLQFLQKSYLDKTDTKMNKTKTVFIKQVLETAASPATFALLCN